MWRFYPNLTEIPMIGLEKKAHCILTIFEIVKTVFMSETCKSVNLNKNNITVQTQLYHYVSTDFTSLEL